MYRIQATAICNKGNIRENNEDNLLFRSCILDENNLGLAGEWKHSPVSTNELVSYGVFDGMGGHSKGEYASYVTASVAKKILAETNKADQKVQKLQQDVCFHANEIICQEMKKQNLIIGTTVAMVSFYRDKIWCCNLGDSGIFRVRDNVLDILYEEHTERRIREMIMGKDKVKGKKFPLTRHLGIRSEEMKLKPYQVEEIIKTGDIYLICTDGLTDMVTEEEICSVLTAKHSMADKIHCLEERAMNNGGIDNITMIYIEIV